MSKPLSETLFVCQRHGKPSKALVRCSARDLGLKESWFRDAIYESPELVVGPCQAAGVTDDEWYAWAREFPTEAGPIDVLLLSSQGRVGIVETKLAYNPENRRRVLAQALDYLAHLQDALKDSMPGIPKMKSGEPVAEKEDIEASVAQGNFLVIIVSDSVDPRVARLSDAMIRNNLTKEWDLVLVDLALFKPSKASSNRLTIVPYAHTLLRSDFRQVIKVVFEGGTGNACVEPVIPEPEKSGRQKWDEEKFFGSLKSNKAPGPVQDLATKLRELAHRHSETLSLGWGTGRHGTLVLKRQDKSLIEIGGKGHIRFRPSKFTGALGRDVARDYRRALEGLAPKAMKMGYPRVSSQEAKDIAPKLYKLIQQTLADARLRAES